MERNSAIRKGGIRVLCLSALAAVALAVSGFFASAAYAASYDAEGVDVTLDGVTYTCDFLADGTAHIETPVAEDNVTVVNVPDTIQNAGKAYTVTEIYFGWGTEAANVEELHLPNTLTKMSGWGFNKFSKLKELVIPGSMKTFGLSLQNMDSLEKLTFEEGVEEIASNMMVNGCDKLKEIELPSSLKLISQPGAFAGASALESIDLPEDLEFGKNAGSAFSDCTSLTSIVLPKTLTKIPNGCFSGCTSLTSVTATSEIAEIGSNAFNGCTSLPGVSFPGTLTSVGYSAFNGCENLTSIPDLSHVNQMGSSAFQGCKRLFVDVDLSSLDEIPSNAFCYAQVNVVKLSSTLKSIGNWAFIWGSLDTDLPDTLESIGNYAFYVGTLPESFVIPDSVTSVGSTAFGSTTGMKEVRIGSGLTSISAGLFDESSVEKIVIDNSKDDVSGTDNLPSSGVEVIYLRESIPDSVGDTISNDADAMTLQGAVDAAPDGVETAIEIRKHVKLGTTLLVPAGKKIKLVSEDPCTILAANNTSGSLVSVAEGASLEVSGNVELRGRYNKGPVIEARGEVVLGSGATIFDSAVSGRASGVVAISGSNASFALDGGIIENNKSNKLGTRTPSGAVHVEGNAEFTMTGGEISGNSAASDGKGGGVCVLDPGLQGSGTAMNTAFVMEAPVAAATGDAQAGGVISGNTAYCGGGVYSYSDGVTLRAGVIRDNTAWEHGGGVYSEGNDTYYSTLHLENARVVENTATGQGGGLWFCPTGDAKVHVRDGALIARNSAADAGDDLVFTGLPGDRFTLTLANRAPGGGKVSWYADGGLFAPSGMFAAVNPDVPRFVEGGDNGDPQSFTDATPNVALKSTIADEAYDLGAAQTTLLITGNTATRGGGIGANGGVVIGKDERVDVSVKKAWADDAATRPEKVTVNLLNGGTVIDSIELSEENGWAGSFDDLPKYALDGSEAEYTVAEVPVDGFTSVVTGTMADGFTVTNTATPAPPAPVDPEPGNPSPDPGNSSPEPGNPSPGQGGAKPAGSKIPDTGDHSLAPGALLAVALLAFGTAAVARRRS